VAPTWVVPAFDEGEDGHAGLGLGAEPPAVDEFTFDGGEETLAEGVVSYASPTEPIEGRTLASRQRLPKAIEVYCEPWSEW
jgi:hypothetical protein